MQTRASSLASPRAATSAFNALYTSSESLAAQHPLRSPRPTIDADKEIALPLQRVRVEYVEPERLKAKDQPLLTWGGAVESWWLRVAPRQIRGQRPAATVCGGRGYHHGGAACNSRSRLLRSH